MSADQLPAIDPAARDLVAAVRAFVDELMRDVLRMELQEGEDATNAYARACMEYLPQRHIPAVVAAHDALAAALNAASPETPPILSIATEKPA